MTSTIARKVTISLKWVAAFRLMGQLVRWLITIFVIRLLSPSDYGLMALAMVTISLFKNVSEMGMESALVQSKENIDHLAPKVMTLGIIINLSIFLGINILSSGIGRWLNEPMVGSILQVLSIIFLLLPLQIIPRAFLRREMAFKKISILDFCSNLSGMAITLFMALAGYGVWALVAGMIGQMFSYTLVLMVVTGNVCRPAWSLRGMNSVIKFGTYITLDRFLWALYSQADSLIIGKILGKDLLGLYSVGKDIATLPMSRISGIINPVAFSGYSRIQDDAARIEKYFLKAAGFTALFTFPIFLGISAVSPELVSLVLGNKWIGSIYTMQVLALLAPMQMLITIIPPALMGIGRADLSVRQSLCALFVIPTSVLVGCNYGLYGVVNSLIFAYPAYLLMVLLIALPVLGISWLRYISALIYPLSAAIIMYVSVMVARSLLHLATNSDMIILPLLITTGVCVYLTAIVIMKKEMLKEARLLFG